ncbi:hypothetical protein JNL27_16425, partial [bacterium]|nr:hypothetical protein [bacterium]
IFMNEGIVVLIAFVVAIIIFIVAREMVCWYWKINEIVDLLKTVANKSGVDLKSPEIINNISSSKAFTDLALMKVKSEDYDGAISNLTDALSYEPSSAKTNYNLACIYSLKKDKNRAFFHLQKTIELGYVNFEKLRTEENLSYLRSSPEYQTFVLNGYKV